MKIVIRLFLLSLIALFLFGCGAGNNDRSLDDFNIGYAPEDTKILASYEAAYTNNNIQGISTTNNSSRSFVCQHLAAVDETGFENLKNTYSNVQFIGRVYDTAKGISNNPLNLYFTAGQGYIVDSLAPLPTGRQPLNCDPALGFPNCPDQTSDKGILAYGLYFPDPYAGIVPLYQIVYPGYVVWSTNQAGAQDAARATQRNINDFLVGFIYHSTRGDREKGLVF